MGSNGNRTKAYICPGQGSQEVGMGLNLFEHSPAARRVFQEVDEVLSSPLSSLMFRGPEEELTKTENAQPAIVAVSLAAYQALQETGNAPPVAIVAGHSLGEYSGLAIAGVLSVTDTIRLVVERSRLMQYACDERPGGMVALIGIDQEAVNEICLETGVVISTKNGARQVTVSGDHPSLARVIDLAHARGARKAISLPVAGAFHSGLMEPAQSGLMAFMEKLKWYDPVVPLVGNCDAKPLTTVEEILRELETQLTSCVEWNASVQFILDQGIHEFVEVGHGRVLASLIGRINQGAKVHSVSDMNGVLALAS